MKSLAPRILDVLPDWNRRIHFEDDAERVCADFGVIRIDTDLITDLGEYKIRDGFPVILIQKFISSRYRNLVLHHEIGHFILHPATAARFSDAVTKKKIEKEANFVAAVAILPRYILEIKTLAEIADEFNIPHKIILFRKWILDACDI